MSAQTASRARGGRNAGWVLLMAAPWACHSASTSPPPVEDASASEAPVAYSPSQDGTIAGDGADVELRDLQADEAATEPAVVPGGRAACRAYIRAYCKRVFTCFGMLGEAKNGLYTECMWAARACPDYFFESGSSRTVESLDACRGVLERMDCSALLHGGYPACATPGNRPSKDLCLSGAQCASGHCSSGFYAAGPNSNGTSCGTCFPSVGPGEACDETFPLCGAGYYCDPTVWRCVPIPEPISVPADAGSDSDRRCGDDAYNALEGNCTPYRHKGETCSPAGPDLCAPAYECMLTDGSATCQAPVGLGERCYNYCDNLSLRCACQDLSCTVSTCVREVEDGQRCDEPFTMCTPGATCTEGICVGDDRPLGLWSTCVRYP